MLKRFNFLFLFLTFFFNTQVQAVELCLALDASGSINSTDFQLQLDGVAAAVENPSVIPQNGTVGISVVQFSSSASVEVGLTIIDSQATATSLATTIRNISKLGGGTDIGDAITACTGTFAFLPNNDQVIDVSTDGVSSNPVPARIAAIAAGVDVVNAIGVGAGVNVAQLEALVWPQPASTLPQAGFVELVSDFTAFTAAIEAKIQAEVGPGPDQNAEPVPTLSEWSLILLSLLMLAAIARDKKIRKA